MTDLQSAIKRVREYLNTVSVPGDWIDSHNSVSLRVSDLETILAALHGQDIDSVIKSVAPKEITQDALAINHEEARQLALIKVGESNLARCYLDLQTNHHSAASPKADCPALAAPDTDRLT